VVIPSDSNKEVGVGEEGGRSQITFCNYAALAFHSEKLPGKALNRQIFSPNMEIYQGTGR